MKIGIDATWAAEIGTGTASYTAGLIEALAREPHELVLYFQSGDEQKNPLWQLSAENLHRRIVDGRNQADRSLVQVGRACRRDDLDVFHSPGYFLPLWSGPKVVTFHDVNMFLQWKMWWRPGMRKSWVNLCGQTLYSAMSARRVVVDSRTAAAQIRDLLHISASRLSVIYPGVDDCYFDPASCNATTEALRDYHGLDRYFLYVGVLSPQKNLEGLIRAFASLQQPDVHLVIAGRKDGPYWDTLVVPLMRTLGIQDRVHPLGVVDREELSSLYRESRGLVFPSFAEGFGLPPLEAMASGAPVVASKTSCLPEVLGDAAILIDPYRVDDMTAAMELLLRHEAIRENLIAKGRERAQGFRWSSAARRAIEIYESVA